jgi:hypothetical protein
MRLETKPVTSMATAVIRKYEVKRRETWLGVACRPLAMDGRIGSTSPMPMNATTDAPAVAHTDLGWRRMPPAPASNGSVPAASAGPPVRVLMRVLAPSLDWLAYTYIMLGELINASCI